MIRFNFEIIMKLLENTNGKKIQFDIACVRVAQTSFHEIPQKKENYEINIVFDCMSEEMVEGYG